MAAITRRRKAIRRPVAILAVFLLTAGMCVAAAIAAPLARASTCTITNDASAPPMVQLSNSTAPSATSASFSPPAGSDVLVEVSLDYDSNTPTGPSVTVADSGGTAFTAGPSAYDGAAEGSYVFSHYYATAPGAVTVTATRSGTALSGKAARTRSSTTTASLFAVNTRVLAGAAASQSGAASASGHGTSGTSLTTPVTTTAAGSDVEAVVTEGSTQSLSASGLATDSQWNDANDGSSTAAGHAKTVTPGAKTVGWTVGSSTYWALAALEVLPSGSCGGTAPVAVTSAASGVSSTAATLNGTVNPGSLATTYQFDYGPTTSYGTSVPVPAGSAGSGSVAAGESYNLAGLSAGTAYHYRIEATNADGTSYGADQQFTTPAAGGGTGPLTWSPPACGGADGDPCVTVNLSATGPQNPSLNANTDYKLVLPATPMTGGTLTISGGHNVQLIGGEIDLVTPCSDSGTFCPGQANGAVYITDPNPGEVYLEGVLIKNPQAAQDSGASCPGGGMSCSTADGIDVNVGDGGNPAAPPTIVMQDIRVEGISGCSGGSDHADVFQPYNAGTATVDVDHLTGTTNCQGMQVDPDYGYANYGTLPSYDLKNVNVDVTNNPYSGDANRYSYWLTYNTSCPSGSISLSNDYSQEPDGTLAANSVWPDTAAGGGPAGCQSSWNAATGQLSFPGSPQITGVLSEGLPPGGDYVPAGAAGIGYVSPGYQG